MNAFSFRNSLGSNTAGFVIITYSFIYLYVRSKVNSHSDYAGPSFKRIEIFVELTQR